LILYNSISKLPNSIYENRGKNTNIKINRGKNAWAKLFFGPKVNTARGTSWSWVKVYPYFEIIGVKS